jgi:hypothetical protein
MDWINVLKYEWAAARAEGKRVCGHAHDHTGEGKPTHINGNGIFEIALIDEIPKGVPNSCAWDVELAPKFLPIARDTFAICQWYRITAINETDLMAIRKKGQIPALFHGIKDDSGRKIIRQNFIYQK